MTRALLLLSLAGCTDTLTQQARDTLKARGFTDVVVRPGADCGGWAGTYFTGYQPNGVRIEGVVCGDEVETKGRLN